FNPFVYGRLHYGQWFLLAGYAMLPWVLACLRRLIERPSLSNAVWTAASLTAVGVASIHLALVSALAVAAISLTRLVWPPYERRYLIRGAAFLLVTVALTLVLSSYWIVPILLGKGPEGTQLAGIGTGDLAAY